MEERMLGDYRLIKILAEHPTHITWSAEQSSIGRKVVVVELKDLSARESFLADIRAKANIDHPLIGSVYEAVSEDDHCYVAVETLPGGTLAERLRIKDGLAPAAFAELLLRVSDAMLHFSEKDCLTEPLTPAAIHRDAHGVVRIQNLAHHGTFDPQAAHRDIKRLGQDLPPLVADGRPGATRVLTVLAWMRGEGIERSLTWEEVRSYAEQIESQLTETQPYGGPPTRQVAKRKTILPAVVGSGVALALIGSAVYFLLPKTPAPPPPPVPVLPEPVLINAGSHPSPDSGKVKLPAFLIGGCEVTIGEYAKFLDTLEILEPERRNVFDAKNQPATKEGHEPNDWDAMLQAAKSGGTWQGRQIDLFCPVVNVDWWDALAYCEWRGCRLPTQEEWFGALRQKVEKPEFLKPAAWGPVTSIPIGDRTPNGMRGMAGSVSEWTLQPAINPANPLGAKRHVIIGGSFLKPSNGALAREWTDDLLQRRPDLGFRVVMNPQ